MNIILTNTDLTAVPLSSTDGLKPWATTLYPQQPSPIGQPEITEVVVGENAVFKHRVTGPLVQLVRWLDRAVLLWRGPRSGEPMVRIGIENVGPTIVHVTLSDGRLEVLPVGGLFQAACPSYVTITEVLATPTKGD
jgi:hypothetical protein